MNLENQPTEYLLRQVGDWNYGKDGVTGELILVRLKFKPLPTPAGISQTQFAFPARFFHGGSNLPHGVYVLTQVELKNNVWVRFIVFL